MGPYYLQVYDTHLTTMSDVNLANLSQYTPLGVWKYELVEEPNDATPHGWTKMPPAPAWWIDKGQSIFVGSDPDNSISKAPAQYKNLLAQYGELIGGPIPKDVDRPASILLLQSGKQFLATAKRDSRYINEAGLAKVAAPLLSSFAYSNGGLYWRSLTVDPITRVGYSCESFLKYVGASDNSWAASIYTEPEMSAFIDFLSGSLIPPVPQAGGNYCGLPQLSGLQHLATLKCRKG